MKMHQFGTEAGRMMAPSAMLYLIVVTCYWLCGPVLCSGVPALRKKEHGTLTSVFITCLMPAAYLFERH